MEQRQQQLAYNTVPVNSTTNLNTYYQAQNDEDSEFYDRPGLVSSRTPQPFPHERPREAHATMPGEPNAYLLNRLNSDDTVRNNGTPPPMFPTRNANRSNSNRRSIFEQLNYYQGYESENPAATDADFDNFRPFPTAGDSYPLNTFHYDDEDTLYSDTSSRQDGSSQQTELYSGRTDQYSRPGDAGDISLANADTPLPRLVPEPLPVALPAALPDLQPQLRQNQKTRLVELFHGNLVLDCPVPKIFLRDCDPEISKLREFTHMRYSAGTCDPNDFVKNEFTLRHMCYKQPRETELLIAITIYNEDDIALARTLSGVFKNIKNLAMRKDSSTWGPDSWKKVTVCVVADGRTKIHERSKALMARLGVYQEGFSKNYVGSQKVEAHIYEYTTLAGIRSVKKTVEFTTKGTVPVQMIFCLKERNQKKINSHRWVFNAFGQVLKPRVCVLLDAGTEPAHDSIYYLWREFHRNKRVGGACGEIRAGLGRAGTKLVNPLVAAQNFEYKMSNILDKPMESVFGFISVLPGAFSAYRYEALLNNEQGEGPLEKYYKGETMHGSNAGIFTANMYLAEDRILCFELVAKRNSRWLLKYVKSAHAVTDVPETLSELVLQRRRWLNGSFFAAIYSISHAYNLWRSSHSLLRKLIIHIEFLYQLTSLLFSWFSIGNFFLVFRILTNSLSDSNLGFGPGRILGVVFLWLYCACIVAIFVLSFGNRPKGTQPFYVIVVIFFAVLMAYLIFAAIYISVKSVTYTLCMNDYKLSISLVFGNDLFRDLVVSLMSTYALYFVSSFLFLEPWHMFTSLLQYLLISPSYINVLNVYAFCNIHDISWGTKGDDGTGEDLGKATLNESGQLEVQVPLHLSDIDERYMNMVDLLNRPAEKESTASSSEDQTTDYYALFRSGVVLVWIFTNFAIVAVVLNTAGLGNLTSSSSSSSTDLSNTLNARGITISTVTETVRDGFALLVRQTEDQCGSLGGGGDLRTQIYLTVVLWCVAALAAFRFGGAMLYLLLRLIGH